MWKPMFGSVCKSLSTGQQRFLSPFTYETGSNVPAILLSILGLMDRRQQQAIKLGYVKSWRYLDDWFCISCRAALCNRSHLLSTLRTNVNINEEKLKALVHSLGSQAYYYSSMNLFKLNQTKSNKGLELFNFLSTLAVCRLRSVVSPCVIWSHVRLARSPQTKFRTTR